MPLPQRSMKGTTHMNHRRHLRSLAIAMLACSLASTLTAGLAAEQAEDPPFTEANWRTDLGERSGQTNMFVVRNLPPAIAEAGEAPLWRASEMSVVQAAASLLRQALGPAWRIRTHTSNAEAPAISLSGPIEKRSTTSAAVLALVAAAHAQVTEEVRASTLPPGSERDRANAMAKAAAERAMAASEDLRVEVKILPLKDAVGEDVAKALKAALPWATFAHVGGTQVVATGTRQELDAATKIAEQLDTMAARQQALAAEERADRGRDTPASRMLVNPIYLDFKGGTLPEYLKSLGSVANVESWVLEDPRLASAFVPQIKLTGVTADSALRMLDGLTFPTADKGTPTNVRFVVKRIDAAPGSEGVPPIYRIGATFPGGDPGANAQTPAPPNLTEVFDVGLGQIGVQNEGDEEERARATERAAQMQAELLAAIEAGVSLAGPSDGFRVKLHAPTSLLFVSGTPAEMSLVRNIIQQWLSRI